MARGMEPLEDPVYPKTPAEAHTFITKLLDEALVKHRSAFMVTMEPLTGGMVDVKSGMMNLDQTEKGLLMMAFAIVQMNKKSDATLAEDLRTLGEYVGRMIE